MTMINRQKLQQKAMPFIWKHLRSRYVWPALLFLVWVIFLDHSRLISQYSLQRDIWELEKDKATYEAKIEEVKREKQDILQDQEKYAREHYFMKRADEDIFIIEDK